MRDDHHRLFVPAPDPGGTPEPGAPERGRVPRRARAAAAEAPLARTDTARRRRRVSFPGGGFAPTRVRVALSGTGRHRRAAQRTTARPARWRSPQAPRPAGRRIRRRVWRPGAGTRDALVDRQGKPMRPDVAAAFDRLAAAARARRTRARDHLGVPLGRRAGGALRRESRSALGRAARHLAPPLCAPSSTSARPRRTAWLAANARRFGFLRRYSVGAVAFRLRRGPSALLGRGRSRRRRRGPDGASAGAALPSFVPARFRAPIARAASRWNVPAGLLAAQLMAESGFNPFAVSPAGARGIAQFMPGTAAAYGLRDPFDPDAAIDAQAHLMSDLLDAVRRRRARARRLQRRARRRSAPAAACRRTPRRRRT